MVSTVPTSGSLTPDFLALSCMAWDRFGYPDVSRKQCVEPFCQ
jgi:hypothetical protein